MKQIICDICGKPIERRQGTAYVLKKRLAGSIPDMVSPENPMLLKRRMDVCHPCMTTFVTACLTGYALADEVEDGQ